MQDYYKGLPIQFIIELYRVKLKAIFREDNVALESLKATYPVLFEEKVIHFMSKFNDIQKSLLKQYCKHENYQQKTIIH